MHSDGRLQRQGDLTHSSASMRELIAAAAAALFMRLFHVFMFYTPLQENLDTSANKSFHSIASSSQCILWHCLFLISYYLCWLWDFQAPPFESLSIVFLCWLCSEEGPCLCLCADEAAHLAVSKFAERAEGDSPQSAVSFLI